jgi:hypothetical protein
MELPLPALFGKHPWRQSVHRLFGNDPHTRLGQVSVKINKLAGHSVAIVLFESLVVTEQIPRLVSDRHNGDPFVVPDRQENLVLPLQHPTMK